MIRRAMQLLLVGIAIGIAIGHVAVGFSEAIESQVYPTPDPAAYADWHPCRDEAGRALPPLQGDDC